MSGPVLVVAAPMPIAVARRLVPGPLRVVAVAPGRALGLVLLGRWEGPSSLHYGELAGLVWPALAGRRPAGWVASMHVDDDGSLAGGRRIWGVPKERAEFRWHGDDAVEVRGADGGLVFGAAWRRPRRALPVPALGWFAGCLHGPVRAARLSGSTRLRPVRPTLDIPADSPLAGLRLGRPVLALAGRADLQAGVPTLVSRREHG